MYARVVNAGVCVHVAKLSAAHTARLINTRDRQAVGSRRREPRLAGPFTGQVQRTATPGDTTAIHCTHTTDTEHAPVRIGLRTSSIACSPPTASRTPLFYLSVGTRRGAQPLQAGLGLCTENVQHLVGYANACPRGHGRRT